MTKTEYKEIVENVDNAFSLVGLLFNFILLYLIITKTPFQLSAYRRILLQNCIVDIFYNSAMLFTRTSTDAKNGNFFMIYSSPFGPWPISLIYIPLVYWIFGIILTLTTLPVQFVYRYFLLVKNINLSNKQYASLLSLSFISTGLYTIFAVLVMAPNEKTYREKGKLLTNDPYYPKTVLSGYVTSDIAEWPLFFEFLFCYSLAFISYIIIAWTSFKTWRYLKAMENHMTLQTREANRQITKTLFMQATLPVFACIIPITTIVSMTFLKTNIDGFGLIVSLLWAWIPIVNTIVTICAVKSYRTAVLKIIPFSKKASIATTTLSYDVTRTDTIMTL
uniref:Uncharacterized protein n=2 Tax=Panagrolaimus davidi TaxID=227884 RepID=A0A914Q7U5_9BILA